VPPLFTEPGWSMHAAKEIGIDDFQSGRSPDDMYRTTPLRGLFTREKGGFYHDGRFKTLDQVVQHYEKTLDLKLNDQQKRDLVQYLKSL
jgi:cytochrome c peroxidase